MEALLAPGRDCGAMEDDHREEGVQQQDAVWVDAGHVQQHWLQGRANLSDGQA